MAATSVLIWPIDPVLEADQKAGALWLENRGTAPANLQVRVFAWRQGDYQEQFQAQREIIGSPPVANIAPGQKQLIRLTRTGSSPAGQEQAYRIIIDEIPPAIPVDTASRRRRRQSVCRCVIRCRCSSMAKGCGARPTLTASAMPRAWASRSSAGAR
jgi:P pilus assembly chaperone PapD